MRETVEQNQYESMRSRRRQRARRGVARYGGADAARRAVRSERQPTRIITLGSLRTSDGRVTRPKPLLLLAYLALEGPTDRERLARLFFSDANDPRDALSTTLVRLGDLIDRGLGGDERVSATVTSDAQAFMGRALRGDNGALELYCGPFVPGRDRGVGAELEEWILTMREQFASVARDLHLTAAKAATTRTDTVAAWRHAQKAVSLTEAHALDPATTGRLLGELADAGVPVPDCWWRAA